jgi:hypothetical protein
MRDLDPLPAYVTALQNAGAVGKNPPTPEENSTCLALALSRARGGSEFNLDNLGSNAKTIDKTTGLVMFADGWGMPIVFYRWPTSNDELDASNPAGPGSPQLTFRDPQDPIGALFNPSWWVPNHNWNSGVWSPFEVQCHSLFTKVSPAVGAPVSVGPFPWTGGPAPNDPTPIVPPPTYLVWDYEYYMAPVVASAGPNKRFGLSLVKPLIADPTPGYGVPLNVIATSRFSFPNPMKSDGSGDDQDNIYSYRLRLGARGD